jgi:hypothetical protein
MKYNNSHTQIGRGFLFTNLDQSVRQETQQIHLKRACRSPRIKQIESEAAFAAPNNSP